MLTPEELRDIEARCDEATEGPWKVDRGFVSAPETLRGAHVDVMRVSDAGTHEDCIFVASARTDVPRLIAEVRRLQAILDAETGKRAPEGCTARSRNASSRSVVLDAREGGRVGE